MKNIRTLAAGIALAVLLVASTAEAWTESFSWLASTGATFYIVEKSLDGGATWAEVARPTAPSYVYTGTETETVLFRLWACAANISGTACTLRGHSGWWHNEAWRVALAPATPGYLGQR